jgi:DNA-3-methyladenine glycosylase
MGDGAVVRLPRAFYARDARVVARALLGKILVHQDGGVRRAVRIVETEAYHGPRDLASHARAGPTPRAAIMFGPPGVAYVYLIYGQSHCMNVVTGPDGFPAAVLLRAGEPVEGCLHSTRGPGNLCRALGIRREHDNGRDLEGNDLFVEDAPRPREQVVAGPRVNVHYAGPWAEKPWRYALAGNVWVSRPAFRGGSGAPSPATLRGGSGAPSPPSKARRGPSLPGKAQRRRRGRGASGR